MSTRETVGKATKGRMQSSALPPTTNGGNGHNREQAILDAAIRSFSDKGYAATSLQEIADAVGLMKGSLYHYITSKESLLYRIFQEAHLQANTLIQSVDRRDLQPAEKLREFTIELAKFYVVNRERASVYFTQARHLTGKDRETVDQQQKEFRQSVRSLVEAVHKAGLTRQDLDVRVATYFLLAAINGVHIFLRDQDQQRAHAIAVEIATLSCSAILLPTPSKKVKKI